MPHQNSVPSFADPAAVAMTEAPADATSPAAVASPAARRNTQPVRAPWGIPSALAILTVGSILTFTVSSTVYGVSLSAVGVIFMLIALAGLTSLLVRAVVGLRRHGGASTRRPSAPLPEREVVMSATDHRGLR
jgi:hypothetical protein